MPENRHRNYTFAILLIVLGVALLLQQLGIWQISWSSLWQLWPLALVFIGLEMLLRRAPMGGLIYLLLVAAILAGVWFLWPNLADGWGRMEIQTAELSAGGISSAEIEITMGVGELEVAALQEPGLLYRATLRHDPRRTELNEAQEVREGHAEVALEFSGMDSGPFVTGDRGRLEIGLARDIPLALNIRTGVSKAQITLSDLTLARLDLQSGVGDAQIALPRGTYEVTVHGGVGALAIELPEDVGAQIEIEGGLGSVQVADRFQRSGDNTYTANGMGSIRVYIKGGIGTVRVR
jgi:hypothetical protein